MSVSQARRAKWRSHSTAKMYCTDKEGKGPCVCMKDRIEPRKSEREGKKKNGETVPAFVLYQPDKMSAKEF